MSVMHTAGQLIICLALNIVKMIYSHNILRNISKFFMINFIDMLYVLTIM